MGLTAWGMERQKARTSFRGFGFDRCSVTPDKTVFCHLCQPLKGDATDGSVFRARCLVRTTFTAFTAFGDPGQRDVGN
jgi:hypothetical protein